MNEASGKHRASSVLVLYCQTAFVFEPHVQLIACSSALYM
jgi:hypothetical protein